MKGRKPIEKAEADDDYLEDGSNHLQFIFLRMI